MILNNGKNIQSDLTKENFDVLFREHLDKVGPNPGESGISRGGRWSVQRRRLMKTLGDQGYVLPFD